MVNCEVDLTLAGGEKITSVITMSSAKRLGLAAGKEVRAVIKASDIMVGVRRSAQPAKPREIQAPTQKRPRRQSRGRFSYFMPFP